MGTPRAVREFVRRFENRIADVVSSKDRIALAYSGGLSSTLVAMVARKRCDLVCVVAGVGDSSDVRAAKAAKDHLDYRIQRVLLDRARAGRIAERLGSNNRQLPAIATNDLVPLSAVLEAMPDHVLLAGFGTRRIDVKIVPVLGAWGIHCPLIDRTRVRQVPRSMLRAAAISLGLPVEWARVAHRSPAAGAGVGDFLPTTRSSRR